MLFHQDFTVCNWQRGVGVESCIQMGLLGPVRGGRVVDTVLMMSGVMSKRLSIEGCILGGAGQRCVFCQLRSDVVV